MKTKQELIYEFGGLSGGSIEDHIYSYFEKLIGDTIASYEIDRVNLVAMTLERDDYDEENKRLVSEWKQIIEQNASQSLQVTLIEHSLGRANATIVDLEGMLNMSANAYAELNERYEYAILDGTELRKDVEARDKTIERLENDLSEAVEIMGAIYDNVDKYHLDFAFHGGECYDRLKEYLGV